MVILPVPGELCRECGLCCRFSDPEILSPWAVRPGDGPPLPALFLADRPLSLVPAAGREGLPVFACDAFDATVSGCSLWGTHPADCRLYPLVLVFRDGAFRLALDPDCPFSGREPLSFFRHVAERFRDQEWSLLTKGEVGRIRELARFEDRPEYMEVLSLPEPEEAHCA